MYMLATTELLIENGFNNQIFTYKDFARLFGGSSARHYGLINKALAKGELIQLHRGVYILAPKYRTVPLSKFFVGCHMVSGSYVSLESALSYHGWIPERVNLVTCVIGKKRSLHFNTPLGEFKYTKIITNDYEFLNSVYRDEINNRPFLIASPLRALADYIYEKNYQWEGINFLLDNLRIEEDNLASVDPFEFVHLMDVYRSKHVLEFLKSLKKELKK